MGPRPVKTKPYAAGQYVRVMQEAGNFLTAVIDKTGCDRVTVRIFDPATSRWTNPVQLKWSAIWGPAQRPEVLAP